MKAERCKGCSYEKRPAMAFPCKVCLAQKLDQPPLTCLQCQYNAIAPCAKRGKAQRRLNPCEDFEFS